MSEENQQAPAAPTPTKPSALERLEAAENTIKQVAGNLGQIINVLRELDQKAQKVDNVAKVLKPLAKGVGAMLQILEDKNILTSAEVQTQIQTVEASSKQAQEDNLVKSGRMVDAEQSDRNSVLAVKLDSDKGEVLALRDHLPLASLEEDKIKEFIGVKVGSVVSKADANYTVLRILNYVESGSKSEAPAATEQSTPEATTETPTAQ